MKKVTKIVAIGFIAALMIPASAMAQNFTYETNETDSTDIGAPNPDGPSYFGSHSTGTSTRTNADGTKVKGKFECIAMSQPPGIFKMHSICNMEEKDGNFSAVFGCNPMNEDGSEISCVGGMRGKTGTHEGKTGSMTFHGKDGSGKGTGNWHN